MRRSASHSSRGPRLPGRGASQRPRNEPRPPPRPLSPSPAARIPNVMAGRCRVGATPRGRARTDQRVTHRTSAAHPHPHLRGQSSDQKQPHCRAPPPRRRAVRGELTSSTTSAIPTSAATSSTTLPAPPSADTLAVRLAEGILHVEGSRPVVVLTAAGGAVRTYPGPRKAGCRSTTTARVTQSPSRSIPSPSRRAE